jgi:hypothetical protein
MSRLLLFVLLPALAYATAQYPERILLDGVEENMMATPLEDYWNESRPKPDSLSGTSTALWRGYIGTWKIEQNRLILLKLERRTMVRSADGGYEEGIEVIPKPAVLQVASDDPLPADWFSGVLRIARGKRLQRVHMGFGSVYEKDLYLFVNRGRLIGHMKVDNTADTLTSTPDQAWRELGNMTDTGGVRVQHPDEMGESEKGNWLSWLEIFTDIEAIAAKKEPIRVRGIFFEDTLWFPPQKGFDASFKLDVSKIREFPTVGSAVEVVGILSLGEKGPSLAVSEIRELPPGAAIQRRPKK